ncbi:MAG TPA: hypothetical protein VHA13_05225 [Gammaproteobacteria bacterium]|nr:hypothetical protein [Gammaproteobacteria bacterium]
MDFRNLPLLSGRAFVYFAQVIIFIFCLSYIELVYYNNILPDKLVDDEFTQTSCTVQAKQLATIGHKNIRYRANFLISYLVNDTPYQVWVTGNGLDQAYHHDQEAEAETLNQFDVGGSYPCWYNPNSPQIAVLVLRHDWMSTLPLLIPTVIAIIMFYYITKSTLQFFGFIKSKSRERKRRYKKH